ncbi:MAG: hypothetical protein IIV92_01465 [Schwartzia sp.]|nr:hypothetical protein [Schwartzia sp. (in: firmicutes)]
MLLLGNKLKRIKKLVAGLTAAGCCWLSFAGVGGVNAGGCPVGSFSMPAAAAAALREPQVSGSCNSGDTWVVYWYLCGSDLESNYGAASLDLQELSQVNLPPNVKFVIETGGSNATLSLIRDRLRQPDDFGHVDRVGRKYC